MPDERMKSDLLSSQLPHFFPSPILHILTTETIKPTLAIFTRPNHALTENLPRFSG